MTMIWDFYETSITCGGACVLSEDPIATLTLAGDGAGSASWASGAPVLPGDPPPTRTGDDFSFAAGAFAVSSDNLTGHAGGPGTVRSYDLSWSEAAGVLDAFHVDFLTWGDEGHFGPTGGWIASDGYFGGCSMERCVVDLVAVDPPSYHHEVYAPPPPHHPVAVPEPMGAAFLVGAAVVGVVAWRRSSWWGRA